MRINTNGEKDYRTDLYERTTERFGVGTKSGGIDAACEFSTQMLRNLERAAEHEDMTEDLAEILSTANVTVEHRVVTGVEIKDQSRDLPAVLFDERPLAHTFPQLSVASQSRSEFIPCSRGAGRTFRQRDWKANIPALPVDYCAFTPRSELR